MPIHAREYQATDPGGDEELRSPYVEDDKVDLSAWARDAIALELPDKILCKPDCAGLCAVCGRDLNVEPHTHEETVSDARWAALQSLRETYGLMRRSSASRGAEGKLLLCASLRRM